MAHSEKKREIPWGTRAHKVVHFDLNFDKVLILKAILQRILSLKCLQMKNQAIKK